LILWKKEGGGKEKRLDEDFPPLLTKGREKKKKERRFFSKEIIKTEHIHPKGKEGEQELPAGKRKGEINPL